MLEGFSDVILQPSWMGGAIIHLHPHDEKKPLAKQRLMRQQ